MDLLFRALGPFGSGGLQLRSLGFEVEGFGVFGVRLSDLGSGLEESVRFRVYG